MRTVDTRGLSCPEPVILTKKALAAKEDSYEILAYHQAVRGGVNVFLFEP